MSKLQQMLLSSFISKISCIIRIDSTEQYLKVHGQYANGLTENITAILLSCIHLFDHLYINDYKFNYYSGFALMYLVSKFFSDKKIPLIIFLSNTNNLSDKKMDLFIKEEIRIFKALNFNVSVDKEILNELHLSYVKSL